MGAWKRTSKKHPCAVCGHDGFCTYSVPPHDGAYWCGQGGKQEFAGWKKLSEDKIGAVYRRDGDTSNLPQLTPAEKELERKEREKAQRGQIAKAQNWWRMGVTEHPDAMRYFEARGVRMADLPGGRLPPAVRCTAEREDSVRLADEDEWVTTSGPVIVAACVNHEGMIRAVQRIYLELGGLKKRQYEKPIKNKLAVGPLEGCAIRLGRDYPGGVLVLCEGLETGIALHAATKFNVWPCVSTSGLHTLVLPPDDAAPNGPIKKVIIAKDYDAVDLKRGKRPGCAAAEVCRNNLRIKNPHLVVEIAGPDHALCPELVDAAGELI